MNVLEYGRICMNDVMRKKEVGGGRWGELGVERNEEVGGGVGKRSATESLTHVTKSTACLLSHLTT